MFASIAPIYLAYILTVLLQAPAALQAHNVDFQNEPNNGFRPTYYHLFVAIDVEHKRIRGWNRIVGSSSQEEFVLIDLASNLNVDSIMLSQSGKQVYRRDSKGQIEIKPDRGLTLNDTLIIYYSGSPRKAKRAPWDGGFVWTQDESGQPWVGVACQGIGASVWWPLRDDLDAEPDSMRISICVPKNLMAVSNGNLESVDHHMDSTSTWNWRVTYPINPYNVTMNVADYVHLRDNYKGLEGNLPLDYYVLRGNAAKAREHFKQVHALLECFEQKLGPYPFYRDGYALVETPYWGMEHQSCVAYGNNFINNEWGFDFIIVHETGHEWFGNNLSVPDNAELWIHESLTTYTEAFYVECMQGRKAADRYMDGHRKRIANKEPLLGPLGVKFNDRKTSDIYYKGAWVWHTIRTVLNDDTLWWRMIRGMRDTFRLQLVNTPQLIAYVNRQTRMDWNRVFDLYLNQIQLPTLEYRIVDKLPNSYVEYRWVLPKGIQVFDLPIRMHIDSSKPDQLIQPEITWKREPWSLSTIADPFSAACRSMLIDCHRLK